MIYNLNMFKPFIIGRNYFYRDIIITIIIMASPFLFYLYTISPKETSRWETLFFVLDLESVDLEVDKMLWHISYKILTIIIFSLWYLTCKHKWKYAILIPLIIEINKLTTYFFEISRQADYKIYYSLMLSLPLIFLLTFLSVKLSYFSYSKSVNQQLDEEIDTMLGSVSNFKTADYKEIKKKLIQLRKEKNNLDKKEYLTKLIRLREEFII
ncbi:hypothetical protein ACFS5M_07860 [Lacinutrix iliipiscaria]|uniref:Uncharacterized protein n=1 Tax=Lacinutrix iliipiscaria TaxID=1230532 RepID=A0ABW5WNU7_9FLAO